MTVAVADPGMPVLMSAAMSEAPEEPRMVQCRKLGKLLPGLKRKPYRNELGQRIYDEVSQEAWDLWLKESVRFINTYRVDLASPEGQKFMLKQAAIFFGFEEGDLAQTAWTPPKPGALRERKRGRPDSPWRAGPSVCRDCVRARRRHGLTCL